MTEIVTAPLIFSAAALLISIVTFGITYFLSEYQLRLNSRIEFHKLLIDINKTLVEHPELLAIYDSPPPTPETDLELYRKLWAFAYMNLNVFECVFGFYGDSWLRRWREKKSYESWKGFLQNTLEQSQFVRTLVKEAHIQGMYHPALIAEINLINKRLDDSARS